ncbi:MAG: glycosyltransferase family A protein [Rivularia sp. (in: cyanobacteria)]
MTKTFSVIIPAYNASQYLSETINSVLAQTFTDFELLIIDDGSTDNTAEIANYYCQLDNRVKLISQTNQGVSKTRNRGINIAKGKYIAFLDSDDQWLPNKLTTHIEHFNRSPNLGISFGRIEFMTSDSKPTNSFSHSRLFQITLEHLYYENLIVTPSNAVIRRNIFDSIGGFDFSLSGTEDAELFFRIIFKGWKVEGIDKVLIRYRTNQAGISSNLDRMEEDWNKFNQKIQTYAPIFVNQHYKQAKAFFLRYLARRALRNHLSPKIGVHFMNRALKSDWKIILREPRRTVLTMAAVYGKSFISNWNTAHQ